MQGMRRLFLLLLVTVISACATQPPVQEMAEARSALKTAKEMQGQQHRAELYLQSAEQALQEASDAIAQERYEFARQKAIEAKRQAQWAARIKQSQ